MNASPASTAYQYDDLGRLHIATYDNGKQITYSYDPAGNRSQVQTANSTPHAALVKKTRPKTKTRNPKRP